MDSVLITFGKYKGLTYKQLIEKDINYALWISDFGVTNERNKDLVEYLKSKKTELLEIQHNNKLDYIKKTFT